MSQSSPAERRERPWRWFAPTARGLEDAALFLLLVKVLFFG